MAECPDGSPQHWVDGLAVMLCHNHCYDIRRDMVDSTASIGTLCYALERMQMVRMDSTEAAMMREQIKLGLTSATKRYSGAIGRFKNLTGTLWMPDFVEQLMETPNRASSIMSAYRKGISGLAHGVDSNAPHNDP